jgi:syntaxin 5
MTPRDRTVDFVNVTCLLQERDVKGITAVRYPRKPKFIQSYAEFMTTARTIGMDMGSTCMKVEKLSLLVLTKSKSFFNDCPAEIQELTYVIKEDLNSLNKQIAKLQEVSRNQRQLQQCRHNLLSHSSSVVIGLQSKLASMSTEFKQALEVRTQNLKHEKCRQDQYFQRPVSSSFPPSALSGHHHGSVLLTDEVSIDMEAHSPLVPVIKNQAMIYDETDDFLQSRAATMQNIESTIVEMGGIFQQLAHIVQEQEATVDRIDAHVQDAELNVEAAHNEILRYFENITSNRWLIIKIFGVLTFFFFFFVVFLA